MLGPLTSKLVLSQRTLKAATGSMEVANEASEKTWSTDFKQFLDTVERSSGRNHTLRRLER
jgi:hypothetical protein